MIKIIVKKLIEKRKLPFIGRLERELSQLSPGRDVRELIVEHYEKKIKTLLLVGIGFVVIFVLIVFLRSGNSQIKDGYLLQRNHSGRGNWEIDVEARIQDEKYPMKLEIWEQKLTKEEAEQKMKELAEKLPDYILGKNESTTYVTEDLNLQTSYSGYPFLVRWISSQYRIIQDDGTIGDAALPKQGERVNLQATISYEEIQTETEIEVMVFPPNLSESEEKADNLSKLVESMQEKTRNDTYLQLPDSMNGTVIKWSEKKDGLLLILPFLFIAGLVGVWMGSDNDVTKKCKLRDKNLSLEYCEFVSKLELLIGSGMTIRGAIEKTGADYRKYRKEGGKEKYVYEELLLCIRKLQDGVSEADCYDFFGKRCNLLCYKKLTSLLIQNLRKGTSGLVYALANETKTAFEERKQQTRRMGEEAQTKLLFPMILMLSVVMIIIMIPAYLSFGA